MEVAIFQDSKGLGQCRSCGAVITWAETLNGKRMPFDGARVTGRVQGTAFNNATRAVEYVDTAVHASHFATCPDAAAWRRKAKRQA
jgi:hypothetical protein